MLDTFSREWVSSVARVSQVSVLPFTANTDDNTVLDKQTQPILWTNNCTDPSTDKKCVHQTMKKVFPKIHTFKNLIRSGISVSTKQTENVKFIEKLVNTSFVRIGCNKYVYHVLRFLSCRGSKAWCDIEDDPWLKISSITYKIIIND